MDPRGRHVLVEISGVTAQKLDDPSFLEALLVRAAKAAGARPVKVAFHQFAPEGVTGVVLLEESHISIHTWPERGYAAVDFYTCGNGDPRTACAVLRDALGATRVEVLEVLRGQLSGGPMLRTLSEP